MRSWKRIMVFCAEKGQVCCCMAIVVPDHNHLCTKYMSTNNTYKILKFSIKSYIFLLCLVSKTNNFVGHNKSNSNRQNKSNSNSKSNKTQQQHQKKWQQTPKRISSQSGRETVWQSYVLNIFKYLQVCLNIF